jgi:hypothetical protein
MSTIALFTDDPIRAPAYRPRHRSKRWERGSSVFGSHGMQEMASPRRADRPGVRKPAAQLSDLINVSAAPDLLDQLTLGQLRCLLEACASSDYVHAVPQIAYLVAHPSHTGTTLPMPCIAAASTGGISSAPKTWGQIPLRARRRSSSHWRTTPGGRSSTDRRVHAMIARMPWGGSFPPSPPAGRPCQRPDHQLGDRAVDFTASV